VALALLSAPPAAEAQAAEKVHRLGYLGISSGPDGARLDLLRQGLRDLGYREGQNFVFEVRYAAGKPERLANLAAERVRLNVDLIVTATATAAVAAKKATQTLPIVMLGSGDAVRQGLVASLARPGGNVTAFTMISPELSRKRLELLRALLSLVGPRYGSALPQRDGRELLHGRRLLDTLAHGAFFRWPPWQAAW
jgi:putative ABC transport system substrate-binding protein